jgi:hypothetical protein
MITDLASPSAVSSISHRSTFPLGVHASKRGWMRQWVNLNKAEPELPDESPSPSPSPTHHPLAIQPTIHFSIKAAVEFVARGASVCGLDVGDWGRKWAMKGGGLGVVLL